MDPLLKALLGFNLQSIKEKKWPVMSAQLISIHKKGDVKLADGSTIKDYIFSGFGFKATCPDTNDYEVDIKVTPLMIKTSNEKSVSISFAGLSLGPNGEDTVYTRGSLGNVELNTALYVKNEANAEITLRRVLGDIIDLGAVGDIPLKFKEASEYRFDINVKASLNMFDNRDTKAEILITFNGEQFIRGYLIADPNADNDSSVTAKNVLYLDLSALKAKENERLYEIIPNICISDIDIKGMLFDGALSSLMPYLNPSYVEPEEEPQKRSRRRRGGRFGFRRFIEYYCQKPFNRGRQI